MSARYQRRCRGCETRFNTKAPTEQYCPPCRKEPSRIKELDDRDMLLLGKLDDIDPDELTPGMPDDDRDLTSNETDDIERAFEDAMSQLDDLVTV